MLRNEDEDELKQILSSTFTNNNYIDEQIQSLLLTNQEPLLRPLESAESQRSSEKSENNYIEDIYPSHFGQQHYQVVQMQQEEKVVEKAIITVPKTIHIFDQFYQTINKSLKPQTLEEVRHKYPLFLLSQPSYEINNNIKELSLSYSGGLLKKNILVMDAGYCQQQKVFKIVVGTDEGTVVIFEPNSSKPQKVIECFNRMCMITCVKWSKNMQYLAISNDEKQLFVYSFKQAIYIENQISYRILQTPIEYCYLGEKQLKNIVIQLYYVQEIPFQMILVTQKNEILKLQMKKHIINLRPQITPFPYKVENFLDLSLHKIKDTKGAQGVVMAISGHQLVTVCLADPFFEVIMVYDKERHGGHFKKCGYPQVSFRDSPCSMMVVWDKYLQILDLRIDSYSPFQYSFSITHKQLLPDSTIIAGFLSNSFIYQVTRVGIKIHSISKFSQQVSKKYQSKQVLFHKLNYSNFCYGQKLQESMSSNIMQIDDLRYLKGLFSASKRTLFLSTNKGIQMIYFTTVQQYVTSLVENNNWKTALQILKNCYLGSIYNLDELQEEIITQKIKEYSMRYINFLQTVILSDIGHTGNNQNNILLLWNQQLIFIFNILLVTRLQTFFIQQVLVKIYKINPNYVGNITPFILTNRITKINYQALSILMETLSKQFVSKLIFNLLPSNNDSDLPHQINNLLIKHEMYLELVDLNQKFKDHYTSIAVLVGVYLKLQQDNQRNIMQLTEQKRKIGKLLAYGVHDSLYSINLNKYNKNQNKEIFQSLIPLLLEQILEILVKQEPVGLFQLILQELYMGNCLQTLNQLEVVHGDKQIMKQIIDCIPYQQVVEFKCQKRYWIAVLKLYSRKIIDVKIYVGLHYLCVQDYVEVQYIERFVNKCYDLIVKQFNEINKEILNRFFDALLSSKHISMIKLVGRMLKRYREILAAIFQQQTQRDARIYEYLDECLPLVDSQALQQIKILLKKNIKLLTYIDANRASDIICKYFLSDLNLFIDDLQGYNSEQMKLIHSVLQLYNYKQSLYPLKIKYLQLLAKKTQYHDIILSELTKQNYPLDESLQICRKYDVLEAYAYLLVKCGGSGNTETAIKVYFKIIWKKIYEIGVNHGHQEKQQLQKIIIKYLKISIKVCMDLNLMSHQSEWFVIMEQLEVLKKNIFKNFYFNSHYCQLLRTIINKEAYPQLVRTLITQISYENVILYLRSKMIYFDLEALQILVDEISKNSIYEIRMYHIFGDSFSNTQNQLRKTLFNSQLKGFATIDTCNICESKGGLLVHYNCGHQIHPGCGQDVRECVICKDVVEVIYQKRIDSSLKIKVDIYSGGLPQDLNDVEHQIEKETKLRRMGYFDQLNQLYRIQA